jgi:hypothetical protein
MRALLIAVMIAATLPARAAPLPDAEFVLEGNTQVETITCTDYFVHTDFQKYGTISGTGCTLTGPFFPHDGGRGGHTSVDFTLTTGATIEMLNCFNDSLYKSPGWLHYSINCTY